MTEVIVAGTGEAPRPEPESASRRGPEQGAEPERLRAPEPECDPNYEGAGVPAASDVDCAGGSGDGPAYVSGPVRVVGDDKYGLDRDGDGMACDR